MLLSGYGFVWDSRNRPTRQKPQHRPRTTHGSNTRASAIRKETLSALRNPMRLAEQDSFERWDMTEPLLPQTSALYALVPYGLGTPYVESLSSYMSRLAEAHVVTVSRLLREMLFPVRQGRIPSSTIQYAYSANGLGKDSEILLQRLQAATGRNDLCRLRYRPCREPFHSQISFALPKRGAQAAWNNGEWQKRRYTARYFGPFALSPCARPTLLS